MANIKVAVRIRPISEREFQVTGSEIVVHADMQEISLTNLKVSSSKTIDSRERTKRYRFDYCFDSSDPASENYANQTKIYETLGQPVIDALFTGYNACLVAYGQSASGKTYTMMGTNDDPGLIPRICDGIFSRVIDEKDSGKMSRISVSYLEVYNEKVRDLLVPAANLSRLRVREHPRLGPYVHGLIQHPVDTLNSLMSRIEEGSKTRKTASTLQNLASSRSHAILTLSVDPGNGNHSGQAVYCGTGISKKTDFPSGCKLHLVDLAGSENSAANSGINRLKSQEGANINKSLVALGNVISALAERSLSVHASARRFIPYRDSTLTWLLKDSLGGNAATIILATVSPASGSYNETSHTLRFAQRAQSVINKPIINEDPVAKIIRELRDEVEKLKALLQEKNDGPDNGCKSLCICQQSEKPTLQNQNLETRCASTSTSNSPTVEPSTLSEVLDKWQSSIDSCSSTPKLQSTEHFGHFGSLEFSSGLNDLDTSRISSNYRKADVSELIEDKVDEPVFVDIPTLVAVLIKPDNSAGVNSHQIEEISSNSVLEDNIYTDFNGSTAVRVNPLANNYIVNTNKNEKCCPLGLSLAENNVEQTSSIGTHHPSFQVIEDIKSATRGESKLSNQRSQDSEIEASSLPKVNKCQTPYSSENSLIFADKSTATNSEELIKPNNDSQAEDDTDRKVGAKEQQSKVRGKRKQSIGSNKRKTSKDSSSSNSKDEDIFIAGITKDTSRRESSVDSEQLTQRPHTIIQRARRADIVAAVTERLYSSKKVSEDSNTASTPASDIRSRENSEVTLATSTRMRLQEISRKMLAKRRKICVDTQTDSTTTVRVKDASILVREPKITRKDACVLTDRHEDYDILLPSNAPVLRVKEVATSTSDSPPPKQLVLLKDASNATETYDNDHQTIDSYQQDSGIVSDIFMSDTQTYANSSFSDAGTSDLFSHTDKQSLEIPIMTAASSNTDNSDRPVNMSAQTNKQDLHDNSIVKCSESKWVKSHSVVQSDLGRRSCDCSSIAFPPKHTCHRPCISNTQCCSSTSCESNRLREDLANKSVISIALPDMINITIESANVLDSKIQVFDSVDHSENHVHIQTEKKEFVEASTLTEDDVQEYPMGNSEKSIKPGNQGDSKPFRIENIFRNPHEDFSRFSKMNETPSSHDNTMLYINSPKTSLQEINTDDLSYHSFRKSSRPFGMHKKLFSSEWREANIIRPKRQVSYQNDSAHASPPTAIFTEKTNVQQNDFERVISWRDIGRRNSNTDDSILKKFGDLKFDSEVRDVHDIITESTNSNDDNCNSMSNLPIDRIMNDKLVGDPEKNFSDDSLESKNELIKSTVKELRISEPINEDIIKLRCPPDVVAHTKKESVDPLLLSDDAFISDDFNDTYVELPKTKLGVVSSEFSTPDQEFKSLIIGLPLIPMAVCEEESRRNTTGNLKIKKRVSFGETNIIESISPIFDDHVHPHSSYKFPNDSTDSFDMNSDLENDCLTRVNKRQYDKKKNILEEYLEEAIVYMRNVNSSNYLSNIQFDGIDEVEDSVTDRYWNPRYKNKDRNINNKNFDMAIGPYDKCLRSMERLEKYLSRVKRQDEILPKKYCMKANASAETKFNLAKFSSDSVNSCWSCSRFRNYLSLDDLNRQHDIENDNSPQRDSHSTRSDRSLNRRNNESMGDISPRKVHRSHSQSQNNSSKISRSSPLHYSTNVRDHRSCENKRFIEQIIDNVDIYPKLTEEALIARVQKSLPSPRCTISKYDSANENSSSNDEFDTCMKGIAQIAKPGDKSKCLNSDKFRHPTSPRVKFFQLLSERRRIIQNSRNSSAS